MIENCVCVMQSASERKHCPVQGLLLTAFLCMCNLHTTCVCSWPKMKREYCRMTWKVTHDWLVIRSSLARCHISAPPVELTYFFFLIWQVFCFMLAKKDFVYCRNSRPVVTDSDAKYLNCSFSLRALADGSGLHDGPFTVSLLLLLILLSVVLLAGSRCIFFSSWELPVLILHHRMHRTLFIHRNWHTVCHSFIVFIFYLLAACLFSSAPSRYSRRRWIPAFNETKPDQIDVKHILWTVS